MELEMENIESKKLEHGNVKSENRQNGKDRLYQVSFRLTKEKLKFLKCYALDKDTNVNKFFNGIIDKMMANEVKRVKQIDPENKSNLFEPGSNIQ